MRKMLSATALVMALSLPGLAFAAQDKPAGPAGEAKPALSQEAGGAKAAMDKPADKAAKKGKKADKAKEGAKAAAATPAIPATPDKK